MCLTKKTGKYSPALGTENIPLVTPSPTPSIRKIFRQLLKGTRAGFVVPWLLAGFAVFYYSLYVNAGLNLGGEGGTAGVVAMRLMSGQRPIVDTFLGYNVMWFLPVAGLFELTGPDYLVLRWYFFAICTATGLLTYLLVHGYTRSAWFSALPAVLAILVPGMMFRNYMPFLGVLNAFLLTRAFVLRRESSWKTFAWALAAGAGLGLTFLFRIDLGIFCALISSGLAVLYPFGERTRILRRAGLALACAAGGIFLAWAVHLPVWNDAKTRGYDRAFLEQYTGWLGMIRAEFSHQVEALAANKTPAVTADRLSPAPPVVQNPKADSWENRGALARPVLRDVVCGTKSSIRAFAACTYLPILISAIAIIAGGIGLLAALVRRDAETKERLLYPLTVLGCSLALFPQFFFFRPDAPHLSEMMVPFLSALALFIWVSAQSARTSRRMVPRVAAGAFSVLCAAAGTVYFTHAFSLESAGSIAARKKVSHEFRALNGVSVKVRDREAAWLPGLRDAILRHASPGEFVLCLPYSPTINFMTNRPSPLYNLYTDNTVGEENFRAYFLDLVAKSAPAVIVVDQRRINGNEISRFQNWAPVTSEWIRKNYVFVGRYFRNEVFVRPDKAIAGTAPEYISVSD